MTPLSRTDVDADEKTKLLHRSDFGRHSSKTSPRTLDALHHSSNLVGQSRSLALATSSSWPKYSDMCRKDAGGQRGGTTDESSIPLLAETTSTRQPDGTCGRLEGVPWSQSKISGQSPDKSPSKTVMSTLEDGVRYHMTKIKNKVALKWPKRQESKEDEDFKSSVVDDLFKRTRGSNYWVHSSGPSGSSSSSSSFGGQNQAAKESNRRRPVESGASESSSNVKHNQSFTNKKTDSSHQCAHSSKASSPKNPLSSTDLCTASTTNRQGSCPASQVITPRTIYQRERLKSTSTTIDNDGNTTNCSSRRETQKRSHRNPWMRSESADHDTGLYSRSSFRPPLARAASASAASSEKARRTAVTDGSIDQRPTASRSFFSIEYLKANLKLDLKLPALPFPKSFNNKQSPVTRQKSESFVSPDDNQPEEGKSEKNLTTTSRQTMTEDSTSTNSKFQSSRYLRLGAHVHEPGRGWARHMSSQDKTDKITQRKPKHPPQNVRRAPSNMGAVSVNSCTQTSPVTVHMIDLGDLQSPPGHPDFDPAHRPWHASSTPSMLWSPRGNGSVETLLSDNPDEDSDSSQCSSSSLQDWQQFRQLSPITEADNTSEDEQDLRGNVIATELYEDSRNCYPEEMLKHKSFQRVQEEDSPLSYPIAKDELNQMSPRDRYLSPTSLCSNRLTIPGIVAEGTFPEQQQAPSLVNWARGYRSAGSFSALESPKIVVQGAVSRSFDASYSSKSNGRYSAEESTKECTLESSPRSLRRSSNLSPAYSSIHRSHTDSHLVDHENDTNLHQPLIRQRSDSAAIERASKRSPEIRRLSEHKRSPNGDDGNSRRGRKSPKVERRRSDSAGYDLSPKRSPDTRRLSDQKSSSRSPSSDETNGRRRRSSPKTDESKKTRVHLLRSMPAVNNDLFEDDIPSEIPGTKWFDVDEDWGSISSCVFNDNGMVVSNKRAKSFDTSSHNGNRTSEIKKRNSLSPRDDRRDSVNRHGDGYDHERRRARSFDSSSQNAHRTPESKNRNSLSPRDDRRDRHREFSNGHDNEKMLVRSFDSSYQSSHRTSATKKRNSLSPRNGSRECIDRLGDTCDQDKRRARSFDSSYHNSQCSSETKKRNSTSPRGDRKDSFNRYNEIVAAHDQERKSPLVKRNRRVEALSPLITISRSFDERDSGNLTPNKESPRRRRTTGSLSLLTDHHPLPDSTSAERKLENTGPRSKIGNHHKGRIFTRVYSDETNRRFIPLERHDRPRRVFSAPSASSPPPSPLYPTVHIVPPPDSVPQSIDFDNKQSAYYTDGKCFMGIKGHIQTTERYSEKEERFHSTPVISIDAFESQGSVEENSGGQNCLTQLTRETRRRRPSMSAAKRAMSAENRSFDMPSNRVCLEATHRRAASFSSFSAPSQEARDICDDHSGSDDDDDDEDDSNNNNNDQDESRQLKNVAAYGSNRWPDETVPTLCSRQSGNILDSHCSDRDRPLRSSNGPCAFGLRRTGSQCDRSSFEEFSAKCDQNSHVPVTLSLADSDAVDGADCKPRPYVYNRVASLDSNSSIQLNANRSNDHPNSGSALRHMTENCRHVTRNSDDLPSSKCALHGQNVKKSQSYSSKQRSRSYECDTIDHRGSFTEGCSSVRKAIHNRKTSSPASCSSSGNSNSNSNSNSNNNLLSIPVWNTALGNFSCSDSRLAVPGQSHGAPLKKTSSVPPSFPGAGSPRSARSTSLQSSQSLQLHSSGKTIRQHSADESALRRNNHLSHPHLYSNASHSSPQIATAYTSASASEGRFVRRGTSHCYNTDSQYGNYQRFSQGGGGTPKSDRRRTSSQDYSNSSWHGDPGDSLSDSQPSEHSDWHTTRCQQDPLPAETGTGTAPEEIETTPLLSTSMAGAVDGRGIEIIVSDENDARVSTVQTGKRAVFRRIWMVLLDNRMAGRPDCERALRPHPEEYRVLKRILNIVFITVGVALLISVFVVIIYTYVVDPSDRDRHDHSRSRNTVNVVTPKPAINNTFTMT